MLKDKKKDMTYRSKKRIKWRITAVTLGCIITCLLINQKIGAYYSPRYNEHITNSSDTIFDLQKGDILIRPNWEWPGSVPIQGGRKYGHVGIVTQAATGKDVEDALKKAKVVEALFFDQKTRKFLFNKEDQIREEIAWISFGKKFEGIRYRLRLDIEDSTKDSICQFAIQQLDCKYNIFSLKNSKKEYNHQKNERKTWHCATLTWQAYYSTCGVDIDANKGILVYPSDIIASPAFDRDNGRVRF